MRLLAALALVLLCAAPKVTRADGSDDAREILSSGEFKFCTDPEYPLTDYERTYCEGIGDSSATCPSLPAACKHQARPPEFDPKKDVIHDKGDVKSAPPPSSTGDKKGDEASGSGAESDRSPTLPSLGAFGLVLFIGVVVAFLALIVRFIWKNIEKGRDEEKDEPREREQEPERVAAPKLTDPVETDVDRLLARARSRAESDPKRAMEDAYAALLRRLEGNGLIHLHPSRTNGDYLRAVREQAELRAVMAGIVRDLERVQFGSDAPSTGGFRSIYERVLPLVGRAAVLAVVLFGASTGLSCSSKGAAPEVSQGGGTRPQGTRAIADLIARTGRKVVYRRVTDRAEGDIKVSVVLADSAMDDDAKDALLDRIEEDGGAVVFVGNAPRTLHLEIADQTEPGTLTGASDHTGRTLVAPPTAHFSKYPTGATLVAKRGPAKDPHAYAVSFRRGQGEVYAFADSTLFRNIAMVPGENASFMQTLFAKMPEGDVELFDSWATRGASSPIASVDHAHLTPLLGQLLASALLLFLYKGIQFGAPREIRGRSRRAFAEHARAIGAAFRRAGASEHALGLFGVWAFDRLRSRGERGHQRGTRHLARVLSARTGEPEADVLATLRQVREMRDEASPPSSREAPPSSNMPSAASDVRSSPLVTMAKLDTYLQALSADQGKTR